MCCVSICRDGANDMTVVLEEFMKDFTPLERAQVAARAAELVREELTLRNIRPAQHLKQERVAAPLGIDTAKTQEDICGPQEI